MSLIRFKAISDLSSRIFSSTLTAFDFFFSFFNMIIYPPSMLSCSRNWEKARREWRFDSKGSWSWCEGDVEVPFESWLFFPSSCLGSKVKRRIELPQWTFWSHWISVSWINLSFRSGGGGLNFSEWPSYSIIKRNGFLKFTGFAKSIRSRILHRLNPKKSKKWHLRFKNPLRNSVFCSILKWSSSKKFFSIFEYGCADQEDVRKSTIMIFPHGVIPFPHKRVSFNLLHSVALESLLLPSTFDLRRIFMLVTDLLAPNCQNATYQ